MRKANSLTLKELVNILAETEVKQVNILKDEDGEPLYGLADGEKRIILLDKNMSQQQKKFYLLHELFHMSDYLRGFQTDEETTVERTKEQYRRMYGAEYEE
jgi:Zn-dependent peptidase ImmA (M78 family)